MTRHLAGLGFDETETQEVPALEVREPVATSGVRARTPALVLASAIEEARRTPAPPAPRTSELDVKEALLALAALLGAVLLSVGIAIPAAHAQSVTLDQFRLPATAEDGLVLSRPDDRGHLRFGAVLALDYALHPLVYEPMVGSSDGEIAIVEHQLVAHLGVSLGLFDRVVVYGGLPVDMVQSGAADAPAGFSRADGAGLGDAWLGARVRLFGERSEVFALALDATVTLPSATWANDAQRYSGDRGATIVPRVLAEVRLGAGFLVTANLGARFRLTDEARLQSLPVGHEMTWGLGGTLPIVDEVERGGIGLSALVEVFGATTFEHFGEMATSPVEAQLGLRLEPICGLFVGLAGGPGLARGYGSPDFRGLLTVGWSDSHCTTASAPVAEPDAEPTPAAGPNDTDGDGLTDDVDACPTVAEDFDGFEDSDGCPELDNDADGIPDESDGCPTVAEDADGWEDADGCPDPDNDADGILDGSDACPTQPEDPDGYEDADGCPDADNDQDTVLDVDDECPLAPGRPEDHGCPTTVRYDVDTGTIVVLQRVEFATGRDTILDRSFPVLEEVRAILAANPQLLLVRIEGHTDARGRDAANLELSRRRSRSVVTWLVSHGIAAGRLEGWGCGETNPIGDNGTSDGRQTNRRVEFHVLDPVPPHGARALPGCVESE